MVLLRNIIFIIFPSFGIRNFQFGIIFNSALEIRELEIIFPCMQVLWGMPR